jgi:beta-lactamase regulating signal transducer with metallopeptidase domain
MMTTDLLVALAKANLAAGVALLAVLALRAPARRVVGAGLAYALWLAVPAAAVGSLLPGLHTPGWPAAIAAASDTGRAWLTASRADALFQVWLIGFAANVALALWRQGRFAAAERAGRAGPAVVGVLQPRLVAPKDFAERFSAEQRRLIRAHERAHMDRQDGRANALAVAAVWVCWFNPLAHVALRAFRCDQELACDSTVLERMPGARRAYAETMLHTEPLARQAVLGLHWLAAEPPIAVRLRTLALAAPSQLSRDIGCAALAALCLISFGAAWGASTRPTLRADADSSAPSSPGASPAATTGASPGRRQGSAVIMMDLEPPDAGDEARVYRR